MSKISGGSAIAMTAAAGVVVVGTAWWYQYGREAAPEGASETTVAMVPEDKPAAPDTGTPAAETAAVAEEPKAEPQPAEEIAQSTPEAEAAEEAAPSEDIANAEPEAAPAPRPVAFDEVRREEDGMTIIAGRADPRALVEVLLDGDPITESAADSQGKFAAITMIAPDGQGHVLSLLQTVAGEKYASDDQIILAPLSPPVIVAEVAPEAETAQTEEIATATQEVAKAEPAVTAALSESEEEPAASPEAAAEEVTGDDTKEDTALQVATTEPTPDDNATAQQAARPNTPAQPAPETTTTAQAPDTPVADDTSVTVADTAEQAVTPTPQTKVAEANPEPEAAPEPDSETAPKPEPAQQVAVLKTSEDGVELLNVPRPDAMENVALDTISYSDAGDVQLAGRAQADTRSVRVYLNNTSIVSLDVDEQGRWRGDLPNVDEGIYTLRVDEVAEDGSVTSRVETPFKREAPEVLAEAVAESDGPLKQITVQKGATLWAIAQERYGDGLLYVNVFQANANDIRDPDLIYPGQVFDLPD